MRPPASPSWQPADHASQKLGCERRNAGLDSLVMTEPLQTESGLPTIDQIRSFLVDHHRASIEHLLPLDGGFWSSAYGYGVGGDEFVLRLSASGEGFDVDQAAHQFTSDVMPVPEVFDVGQGLGRWFAISRRAHGHFLEDVGPEDAAQVGPMIDQLLDSLRTAPTPSDAPVAWSGRAGCGPDSWRGWLERHLVDDPESTVSGWRSKIAQDPELDRLYRRTEARIIELLGHCPERRDLIHGDLLHQNVLVSNDASAVHAVFSWKHSVLGDHLYDVAWLSFWEPWHPGIERIDPWSRTVARLAPNDMHDAAIRHHCYELHIGLQHLAWCSWAGNAASLAGVALRTAHVLERGPRPTALNNVR